MLVCLDCWDQEHHKLLNVIDKETVSMMLVSTRIAGLISSDACTQVKLSLMSTKVRDLPVLYYYREICVVVYWVRKQ